MEIVFEDKEIIVIVKPYNYATHRAESWEGKTVLEKLEDRKIKTSGDKDRMGIVHRLDVGTSGLLVIAKNEESYQNLLSQFKKRTVKKKYYAVVQGYLENKKAIINLPIMRKSGSFLYTVDKKGKESITKYSVVKEGNGFSFLDIKLLTGRTHQIRVHFSYLKHPVAGDSLYGANLQSAKKVGLNRLFLHSYFLEFNHPKTNKKLQFKSDLPVDLKEVYAKLLTK